MELAIEGMFCLEDTKDTELWKEAHARCYDKLFPYVKQIIIFITENDTMGMGLPMYHNDEDPVGRLVHDFRSTRAADMFYSELARQFRYFKETEGGQQKMCKAIEDMRKKERADTMFNNVKALMESMKWTAEQAMNAMKISEDDRQLLLKRF